MPKRIGAKMFARYLKLSILSVCLLGYANTAFADDPKSQAEVDRRFPLPQKFSAADVRAARALAQIGAKALEQGMFDYPSTRFKDVRAMLRADWRSSSREYYICGSINGRNRMGGYTGWQHFVVEYDAEAGEAHVYPAYQPAGEFYYQLDCTRGRADRFVGDVSVDYAKILGEQ